MADQDITVREISGTKQTIDILNKEKGLVAMTLSKERPPLKYVAVSKSGSDKLLISGQKEYVLDLKTLGNVGSFPGLYVHKEGQDWKTLVNGQDSNKKTFHFAATDISGEGLVTIEESAITKLRFDLMKGSILQGGISAFGISAPFQLKATVKKTGDELLINGQRNLSASPSKDSSDIVNLVVHKADQDWQSEVSGGHFGLTDIMTSQFIIMNMLHKDITVEETSSGQSVDVQQSEMMQIAKSSRGKKDAFKFDALIKDSKKQVLINGQSIFTLDINDLSLMNILVVHNEGQNWQQIQSSLLQTGSGAPESLGDLIANLSNNTSADYASAQSQTSSQPPKYHLQITAVNMLQKDTIVLEEVTDKKENVDIPGNATATLGLLISGGTQPLRFKASVKSNNEPLLVNGQKELLVDPKTAKGLESIIVIGRQGDSWDATRVATLDFIGTENQGLVQVSEPSEYDNANDAKALQLKVINKAATNIRIQEISSAGQRLDVPNEATATLGFLIRARQEPLKFKAFVNGSGEELLLNGQKILPIDIDATGFSTIIVVHKPGFQFETARYEEFRRMTQSNEQQKTEATSTALTAGENIQSGQSTPGSTDYGKTNSPNQQINSGSNRVNSPVSSQSGMLSPSSNAVSSSQSSSPASSRGDATSKQQFMPEKIDFIIANGANGFVYVEETSGTFQRIELPRKDILANLTVKAKSRFAPLSFRATMKDSSQELYINGKSELDVSPEALSPYWLVIHAKGQDWQIIRKTLEETNGLKVDLSQPGVTKLTSNSIPSQLRMIPVAFNNIAGKEAEISETTGTLYKTAANPKTAGMFVLPATPIGRSKPVKLRASVKGSGEKLLVNGEEEYPIDVNAAYVVVIIHTEEQRWESARKNFHYATLGNYADIAGNGLGNFGGSDIKVGGQTESKATQETGSHLNDTMVGSGQAPTSVIKTATSKIQNSAGVDVDLRLNGKSFKNVPAGATGTVSFSLTGATVQFEAVAVRDGTQLLINNKEVLIIKENDQPSTIVISSQNSSQLTNEQPSESGDQSAMKYGKVNFINRADKEVKIFEVSGIGEPTVLSPNFISTFFLKSPKESATFRAIDPNSNEAYLLNDQPSLEIKLDQNPRVETEVQVTAPKTLAKSAAKKAATCLAVTERGPCYSALQYETQVEAAEGKSETCKKYLEETLSKCAQKNVSQGIEGCKKLCNSKDSDVCERIWSPKSCSSSMVRYSFNPEAQTCQSIDYNGCLGNENNFATPEECAKTCLPDGEAKKPKRSSFERKMRKILIRNRLIRPARQLDSIDSNLVSRILAY